MVLVLYMKLPNGSRNGEYPIKGIDTAFATLRYSFLEGCRNGEYPIKGIDTSFRPLFWRYV